MELSAHYLALGNHVLAIARKPAESSGLLKLQQKFGKNLETAAIDLTTSSATDQIIHALESWDSLDLLINNAGIYAQGETKADFLSSFETNSVMPLLVTQAALSKLKKAKTPTAAFITSLMGSIGDNTSGGSSAYRASKAALNMIVRTLSLDEPWLKSVLIHPGWVKTQMGGAGAPVSVEKSVAGITQVIERLKSEDSGSFYDFEGDKLPW